MTNHPPSLRVRRAARALALVPAVVVTSAAGAAYAAPPETWDNGPDVSTVYTLLVLGGIPLALLLLITLLVYLPSMTGRDKGYQPGQAWRGEAEWFGGPRGGLEAADAQSGPAVTDGLSTPVRGGTSGRW
ncbi:MAG TPA: hypothetical protein VER39_15050 [Nocardioidaceae bacterium]|nr:hypothetical protein [Nocardioidaceae bacterium]